MISPKEWLAERKAEERANRVLAVLVSQSPNGMRLDHMRLRIKNMSDEQILEALERLVESGKVRPENQVNPRIPGRERIMYTLSQPSLYPLHQSIAIRGIDFPRAITGDRITPEDHNLFIEALARYDSEIEKAVSNLASRLTRQYWANIAVVFALFVSVFALILRTTDPISVPQNIELTELLWFQVVRIIPLGVLLFGFVALMWVCVRKL